MTTEGDPADFVKVLHLLVISFSWGMQVWVSFIAGLALVLQVSLHTFGYVQSKLFPVYFYCLLASNCVSLAVYAVYHPRELLDGHESLQMLLYFVAVVTAALNAKWFSPAITEVALKMRDVEKEHGLGNQIGTKSHRDKYEKLKQQDPKYRALRKEFERYHALSLFSNFTGFFCTTVNLIYIALKLPTF